MLDVPPLTLLPLMLKERMDVKITAALNAVTDYIRLVSNVMEIMVDVNQVVLKRLVGIAKDLWMMEAFNMMVHHGALPFVSTKYNLILKSVIANIIAMITV